MRYYTEEERAWLNNFIPGHSHKEIREAFLERFGGELAPSFPQSYIKNHKIYTGRTGQFKKGYTPPNKGKKLTPEAYEKAQRTMFKKGHVPQNTLPVGAEMKFSDGYWWRKLDDKPKVPKQENWRQIHRIVYEENIGPIPEGHKVIFLDGNKDNIVPENLAAVSQSILTRLNHEHLRFTDPELTNTGIAIAELKTKTSEAKKRAPKRKPGRKKKDNAKK